MVITRFAPSPTGRLHAGNIRTALVNWLCAKAAGGRFLLRLDDTDQARSSEASAQAIRDDLAWLGLIPDSEARQSDRFDRYEQVLARLAEQGRAYKAWDTPEELELKRRLAASRGLPPVYDRAALALTPEEQAAQQTAPHWRFKLDHESPIAWEDGVRGLCQFQPAQLSDPVIRRADGSWLYMLPSVIDDADMGVTDVVRGEDHVSNSAIQLQMFEALGSTPPRLAHLALLTGADAALSKRIGSTGADQWQADGIEPLAVCALLAHLGTSQAIAPITSREELIQNFSLSHFGRAPARFDPEDLATLSQRTLHILPFERVQDRLPGTSPELWKTVQTNITRLSEIADWQAIITGPITLKCDEADESYIEAAHQTLETLAWDENIWSNLTTALKALTGRKGKALFLPLRRALTGLDHGPEMAALMPLIGRSDSLTRLSVNKKT